MHNLTRNNIYVLTNAIDLYRKLILHQ